VLQAHRRESFLFQGRKTHTLDAKGRVSIPEEFRKQLRVPASDEADGEEVERFVLTRHPNIDRKCVCGWPLSEWEALLKKVEDLTLTHAIGEYLDDLVISTREICICDQNGRVVVSPFLREECKLAGKVLFVGRRKNFEIWDPIRHRDVEEKQREAKPTLSDYGI
jgi:MraZ protein